MHLPACPLLLSVSLTVFISPLVMSRFCHLIIGLFLPLSLSLYIVFLSVFLSVCALSTSLPPSPVVAMATSQCAGMHTAALVAKVMRCSSRSLENLLGSTAFCTCTYVSVFVCEYVLYCVMTCSQVEEINSWSSGHEVGWSNWNDG